MRLHVEANYHLLPTNNNTHSLSAHLHVALLKGLGRKLGDEWPTGNCTPKPWMAEGAACANSTAQGLHVLTRLFKREKKSTSAVTGTVSRRLVRAERMSPFTGVQVCVCLCVHVSHWCKPPARRQQNQYALAQVWSKGLQLK